MHNDLSLKPHTTAIVNILLFQKHDFSEKIRLDILS